MDEDLILPETDTDEFVDPTPPPKKTRAKLIIIASTIGLVLLIGALAYVIISKSSSPEPAPTTDHTDQMSYDEEAFNEALAKAEERLSVKDYVAVAYYTKDFSLPEHMTLAQKYRYYSLFADLYSAEHLDNESLNQKYAEDAEATLELIRKGEK